MSSIPMAIEARLNAALQITEKLPNRFLLDQDGHSTKNRTSTSFGDRLSMYARERQRTVATLMVIGEKVRTAGAFEGLPGTMKIAPAGAFYQEFQGTTAMPACHTSPTLLTFGGLLPHTVALWTRYSPPAQRALQQRIILTFGHCILMPDDVNRCDEGLDTSVGGPVLARAMTMVRDGASAPEATHFFQEEMSGLYRYLLDLSPRQLVTAIGYLRLPALAQSGPGSYSDYVTDCLNNPQSTTPKAGKDFRQALRRQARTSAAPNSPDPDASSSNGEDAIIARLDDRYHEQIRVYQEVNARDLAGTEFESINRRIDSEVRAAQYLGDSTTG